MRIFFLPLFLWVLFTPFSSASDLEVSRYFYQKYGFVNHPLWHLIYIYAIWPAWILTACALIGFILSFFENNQAWRKPCLLVLLTLTIGAGLIVHAALKEHWGRPRPRQVVEFGGAQPFRPYYEPYFEKQAEPFKSFACGHCTMGFLFFSFALLGIYFQKKWLYWGGMLAAWTLGILLSLARIVEGGHFLSDTLASALIMWLTAWGLFYLLGLNRPIGKPNP